MAANSKFAMAVHVMVALTLDEDELLSSSYLAESLNTNAVVVRRILSDLQKAGLLETQSGRAGGARLRKPARSISLHDVYRAVDEGQVFAYNPNDPNKKCPLSCQMKTALEPVFALASDALAESLGSIKLSEVAARVREAFL